MRKYTTIQGETWDAIAFKLWGSEYLTPHLFDANPQHAETLIFEGNTVLNVPEINIESTTAVDKPKWITGGDSV